MLHSKRKYYLNDKRSNYDNKTLPELRTTPDWEETAVDGSHLWVPTSVSGDLCYVGESLCTKNGNRLKCSSCKIIAHQYCVGQLINELDFKCRSTFENKIAGQNKRQISIKHHWVRRYTEKTKCRHCKKGFKIQFGSKEFVSISCTWCKSAFHPKCFKEDRISPDCSLGVHNNIIVPPNWIFKLSNEDQSNDENICTKTENDENIKNAKRTNFIVRAIPANKTKPLIVFINPKSGGNQGLRLLQKFQWLLNPRQVFDLTQGGPKLGLQLYQKVHNLRVLACGGDGTVGWVLSVIDQIGITPAPAVGVLPLGTGNDLARALGWGGGYTDEPVAEILSNMSKSQPTLLDRWKIEVEKNPNAIADEMGNDNLPLNVINNYFSIGVDAHIALEFHEAREAHPSKFNSRIKNKMFYGQLGGKDLLQRKWKSLTDFICLECDGVDFTPKLKELKVHAIVFLNIPSYGGGTRPWNSSLGTTQPSTEDGLIEVLGLTTYQLPLLQAGGHGSCITQCKTATIVTSKTIPMQVDGEACKVAPAIIKISTLNKATMLANKKNNFHKTPSLSKSNLEINVRYLPMSNYEKYYLDQVMLTKSSSILSKFDVNYNSNLVKLRDTINDFLANNNKEDCLFSDWYFLDCGSAERLSKVDREDESYYYVSDIIHENSIYLVEYLNETRPLTPKSESSINSPSEDKNTDMKEHVIITNKIMPKCPKNPKEKEANDTSNINKSSLILPTTRLSLSKRLFDLTDHTCKHYRTQETPFQQAVMAAYNNRNLKTMQGLRRQGPLATVRNQIGCNFMHSASVCDDSEMVDFLMKYVFTNYQSVEHSM